MKNHHTFRRSLITASAVLFIGLPLEMGAQAQVPTPNSAKGVPGIPKVISAIGKGATQAPRRSPRIESRGAPQALDLNVVRAALKASSGKDVSQSNEYLTLTPQTLYQAGKGYIGFFGVVVYAPAPNFNFISLDIDKGPGGFTCLELHFKPAAAGKAYLVDLSLETKSAGTQLAYYLPDGSERSETFPTAGVQHVLFLISATSTEWQEILVEPSKRILFTSCRVTTVQ